MSGRNKFNKVAPLLLLASSVFRLLPRFVRRYFWVLSDLLPDTFGIALRYSLARSLAKGIGGNVYFGRNVVVKGWDRLELGENVSIHDGCYLDAIGGVVIGDDVSIAHSSSVLSFEHQWDDELIPIKYNELKLGPVTISSDVWVGCGVRILAGVTVGERVVIGAGGLLNKSIPKNSLAVGIPARVVRSI